MKLIAQLKLLPTPEQAGTLQRTLEQANAACNEISSIWRLLAVFTRRLPIKTSIPSTDE